MNIKTSSNRRHYILNEKETIALFEIMKLEIKGSRMSLQNNTFLDIMKSNSGHEFFMYNARCSMSGFISNKQKQGTEIK